MVAMGMGDQDMRHRLAAHRIEQRLGMHFAIRTGIDDRDLALAYDVADCAGEGERARIVAQHAADTGAYFLDDPGLEGEFLVEGDVVVVGHDVLLATSTLLRRHARSCAGHPRPSWSQDVDGRDKPGHDGILGQSPATPLTVYPNA